MPSKTVFKITSMARRPSLSKTDSFPSKNSPIKAVFPFSRAQLAFVKNSYGRTTYEKLNMSESFRFRLNGVKIKASGALKIDPDRLRPGITLYFGLLDELPDDVLEVKSGYNEKFTNVSVENFPDAIKLRIKHISWASKVVLLVERYEVDMERAQRNFIQKIIYIINFRFHLR